MILLVLACALAIGLCTSLLTRSPAPSGVSRSDNTTLTASAPSAAPTGDSPSQALTACLARYADPTLSPLSYPCADCVALLQQQANDYAAPLVNGNSTGVGGALQLCALVAIYQGTSDSSGLKSQGWGKGSVCSWEGVSCDDRGRVSSL